MWLSFGKISVSNRNRAKPCLYLYNHCRRQKWSEENAKMSSIRLRASSTGENGFSSGSSGSSANYTAASGRNWFASNGTMRKNWRMGLPILCHYRQVCIQTRFCRRTRWFCDIPHSWTSWTETEEEVVVFPAKTEIIPALRRHHQVAGPEIKFRKTI